jgi:hypothetical protein
VRQLLQQYTDTLARDCVLTLEFCSLSDILDRKEDLLPGR